MDFIINLIIWFIATFYNKNMIYNFVVFMFIFYLNLLILINYYNSISDLFDYCYVLSLDLMIFMEI
jgi:hypothetical protein